MMTTETLGARLQRMRKQKNLTQDEVAERLNVSPQAVSKWENDQSCPDIMLLPQIAKLYETTTDILLGGEEHVPETRFAPPEERKSFNQMMLRIRVNSSDGDIVRVNLPLVLIKVCLESGLAIPQLQMHNEVIGNIDWKQIMLFVEQGVIGKLVEVQSADGDTVEITVE